MFHGIPATGGVGGGKMLHSLNIYIHVFNLCLILLTIKGNKYAPKCCHCLPQPHLINLNYMRLVLFFVLNFKLIALLLLLF